MELKNCILSKRFFKNNKEIELNSNISYKEFIYSINVLLAFSFNSQDAITNLQYYNNDYRYTNTLICKKKFKIYKNFKVVRPYYIAYH